MNNCLRPPHFPPHCGCPAGAHDPRDRVGDNPTGRPRKSSAGKRRQEAKKAGK